MKKSYTKSKTCRGYTLIEILVVIAVFGFISIVASQTIISTLRGTKKADSIARVRQNLDYAMGVMERQIRSAKAITSTCNGSVSDNISFTDQYGNAVTFSCVGVNPYGDPSSIASSSASLTGTDITISACSFVCTPSSQATPPSVMVGITAADTTNQGTKISVTTQVTLRTY